MQEAMIRLRNMMECDHCIVSTGCILFFRSYKRRSDCSQWVRSINYVTRKIYVLIENNPIIRTYCKKILNFQIYIPYDLNKVCRNIYTYGTYNMKLRVRTQFPLYLSHQNNGNLIHKSMFFALSFLCELACCHGQLIVMYLPYIFCWGRSEALHNSTFTFLWKTNSEKS